MEAGTSVAANPSLRANGRPHTVKILHGRSALEDFSAEQNVRTNEASVDAAVWTLPNAGCAAKRDQHEDELSEEDEVEVVEVHEKSNVIEMEVEETEEKCLEEIEVK